MQVVDREHPSLDAFCLYLKQSPVALNIQAIEVAGDIHNFRDSHVPEPQVNNRVNTGMNHHVIPATIHQCFEERAGGKATGIDIEPFLVIRVSRQRRHQGRTDFFRNTCPRGLFPLGTLQRGFGFGLRQRVINRLGSVR